MTELTPDGKDRVAKPATLPLTQGGDLALWFQVSSAFGCSEFDSAFGQNFHVEVEGPKPDTSDAPRIAFARSGDPQVTGTLRAGGKVKVLYEQDRLPQCRRVQLGNPVWNIGGFASLNGEKTSSFATGRPSGSDREEIEALLDVPKTGELALWFEVTSLGGCHEVDSNGGKNYRFNVQ